MSTEVSNKNNFTKNVVSRNAQVLHQRQISLVEQNKKINNASIFKASYQLSITFHLCLPKMLKPNITISGYAGLGVKYVKYYFGV